ncbi:MAG: MurR/RpiR family transcriptional regulator [Streptococcaceae bacterium]|jgi:DNA-binding MurR/RpiR family transcriptional regulator|nr:MurR/RpiR family transcriptional regulator [Streptococcaceae bacterium]
MGILLDNFYNLISNLTYAEYNALISLDSKLEALSSSNLTHLSLELNTSNSTIIRLTQKLGFSGFSEFKNELKHLINQTNYSKSSELFDNYKSFFTEFSRNLDTKKLDYFAKQVYEANNLWIIGGGLTKPIAEYMSKKLYQLDRASIYVYEDHMFDLLPNLAKKGDLIIFISASGDTKVLTDCAKKVVYSGTTILSITNNSHSLLNQLASESLSTDFPFNFYHNYDITSRAFQVMFVDLILDVFLNTYLHSLR